MVVGGVPSREGECDGLRETTNRKQGDYAEKRSLFVHNDRFLDKGFLDCEITIFLILTHKITLVHLVS